MWNGYKYESNFNNNHNALHVFTGDLHGEYIDNVLPYVAR